ncbi:Pentatricopeptide repeat [Dillenia turbinata]|uniref:Pentatricopeptide repeat n=1 Tax=Dillenia turbinata TaxID=194707 RepID=A0AAN8Z911_9MAGN
MGFQFNVYATTALTDTYMKLKSKSYALKTFDEMPERNLVSVKTAFSGFCRNGCFTEAIWVVKDLVCSHACEVVGHGRRIHCWVEKLGVDHDFHVGTSKNSHVAFVLSACLNLECLKLGRQVHGLIMKTEMRFDVMVESTLVGMHAKCGRCKLACDVFKEMGASANLITWN